MAASNTTSQCGQRYQFDVLVIGSGIASLSYILELLKLKPNCKIALITKKELDICNSTYAQGGIAAVASEKDSFASHSQDTLLASDGLGNIEIINKIIADGPRSIENLIDTGVTFDHHKNKYDLAQEGGHSHRRIYHFGDHTGKAIITALIKQVKKSSQITIFEHSIAINLITQTIKHNHNNTSEVIGIYALNENSNQIHIMLANVVVLATGGAGKVYRYTSNLEVATGDGIAMAYRAGARIGNLEFYQFHPTLLYHTETCNFLITEAMRGEGAYLLHPETKKRFMKNYDPKRMELATRDIVARAIFNEIETAEKNFIYLDVRHKPKTFLQKRFPYIYTSLLNLGMDLSKDLIPVVPGAHYLCGGILTDIAGRTDIQRLYAIGETAFTGFHGANRLASNSLLEGTVMAHYAAKDSMSSLNKPYEISSPIQDWNSKSVTDSRRASQINSHWRSLRGEMFSYAGIIRTDAGLKDLLKLILTRKKMIEEYYWQHTITQDLIELRNIVLIAELITRSALARKESRGGHYREDYPHKNLKVKNTILRYNKKK